jgi:asparagine synthase (glutamine-hydrolysing)
MSMAHGIEVRVPFLDRRIMEFAGRLHSSLLTSIAGPDKRVLRLALERAGASPAVARARKRGFNVPIAAYLRAGLRRLGEHVLVKQADALYPFFNPPAVARLWQDHVSGEANHGYALWTLLTFAAWRERTDVN